MAVAIATVRFRPRPGPALRRGHVPVGGLVLSGLVHGTLIAIIVLAGHVWRASQPKIYVVNLVPAIAAVGSPRGSTRVPEPTLPRMSDLSAPRPTPAPSLPEREPTRAPERPTRATDLPDRARPARAPALPRPGEKELPRVASVAPPPVSGPAGRTTSPPPPVPIGRETGSPQGVGALTLNAADFPFAWYLRQVQSKIGERWEGQARNSSQPLVVFEIGRDGKIRGVSVEKSSGNPLYDQAAMRAITEAAPFPPLPEEFKETFLRIHLGFNYAGTRG